MELSKRKKTLSSSDSVKLLNASFSSNERPSHAPGGLDMNPIEIQKLDFFIAETRRILHQVMVDILDPSKYDLSYVAISSYLY